MKPKPIMAVLSLAFIASCAAIDAQEINDPLLIPQEATLQQILDNKIEDFRTNGIELFRLKHSPNAYIIDFRDCSTQVNTYGRLIVSLDKIKSEVLVFSDSEVENYFNIKGLPKGDGYAWTSYAFAQFLHCCI